MSDESCKKRLKRFSGSGRRDDFASSMDISARSASIMILYLRAACFAGIGADIRKEIKNMTYKEFTECARHELVSDCYGGGVYGCPYRTKYKDGARLLSFDCNALPEDKEMICDNCWNQEMDANETARAIELYGSEWYLSALAYIGEKKHDSTIQK